MKPHKLLPLLPWPILFSSIVKLIRLPASLLLQNVLSIKPAASLYLSLLPSQLVVRGYAEQGVMLQQHIVRLFQTLEDKILLYFFTTGGTYASFPTPYMHHIYTISFL